MALKDCVKNGGVLVCTELSNCGHTKGRAGFAVRLIY